MKDKSIDFLDLFEKNFNILESRIFNLYEKKFYIESVILMSNIVEGLLVIMIEDQENYLANILQEKTIKFQPKKLDALIKKTLGQLIENFSIYSKDTILISNLNNFNSLRVNMAHKLLTNSDIRKEDIRAKEIFKKYISLKNNLLKNHIDLNNDLQKELNMKIEKIRERRQIANLQN